MVKKLFNFIVLLIFFIFINSAYASLSSELSNMINGSLTNVTDSGVYKTQSGGIAVGGSVRVRVPYKNIQIASISPPKIKAGCGGIDLYWGAFSFINKQELTQLLQAISANAVGYAFEMALEALCPTCNAVIKDLANRINKMLGMLNNSCYMAKALVNSTIGAFTSATEQQCERVGADEMAHPDRVSARLACITEQGPSMQKVWNEFKSDVNSLASQIGLIESKENDPDSVPSIKFGMPKTNLFGNVVMNILNKLNISSDKKELFMSMVGTCIFGKPESSTGKPNIQCYAPTIDLHTIIYGNSDNSSQVKVYKCDSMDGVSDKLCLNLHTEETSYTPLLQEITTTLNSIKDKISIDAPPSDSVSLSDDEKNLIEISPTPVLALLKEMKKRGVLTYSAYSQYVINNSSEYVAVYIGNYYINRIISILRKYQLTLNIAKGKEYIKTLIENAEKNRNVDFTSAIEKFKSMFASIHLAEVIQRQMTDVYKKTKKSNDNK